MQDTYMMSSPDVNMGGDGDPPQSPGGSLPKKHRTRGAKVFQCAGYGDCNMTFSRSEHLARHIRKHTGERPFRCHCGRTFSRLDNLRQHVQTVHANESHLYQSYQNKPMPGSTPQPTGSPQVSSATPQQPYFFGQQQQQQQQQQGGAPFFGGQNQGQQSQWLGPSREAPRLSQGSIPSFTNVSFHSHSSSTDSYTLPPLGVNHAARASVSSVISSASSVHSMDSTLSAGSTASSRSQTSAWLSSVLNAPDSPPQSGDANRDFPSRERTDSVDSHMLPSVADMLPPDEHRMSAGYGATAGQSSVAIPQGSRSSTRKAKLLSKPLPPLPPGGGPPGVGGPGEAANGHFANGHSLSAHSYQGPAGPSPRGSMAMSTDEKDRQSQNGIDTLVQAAGI